VILLCSEQQAVAFRAAGHIFISHLVGKKTIKATIDPGKIGVIYQNQFVGRVWVEPWIYPDDLDIDDQRWNDVACQEVALHLAGLVVEDIRMGRTFDDIWDGIQEGYINQIGLASDWIDAWLTSYADPEYSELHTRFWVHGIYKHTRELLWQYWPLIGKLADALLERGTLAGYDIDSLLCRAGVIGEIAGYPAD
jgi:hypothetical protein